MTVKARIQPGDGDPRHGTANGYKNLRCRCDDCREAATAYLREQTAVPCAAGCGRNVWGRYRPGAMCRTCIAEAMRTAEHGTESRYTNSGCRCGPCTRAANSARAERRGKSVPSVHNRSGYTNGCRCDVCRDANRAYNRARRAAA